MTPDGHRRLILTRHAKSDWSDPSLPDHDRPLNGRGQRAATELGQWLVSRDYLPDQVLCSDACRTRETWAAIARSLSDAPDADLIAALYHAEAATMLQHLKGATGQTVMMIGHNPGIGEFASTLPATPPTDPDFARYPTSATLVVNFDATGWDQITPGTGATLDFFTPSERG